MDGNTIHQSEKLPVTVAPVLVRATHLRKAFAGNSVLADITFELRAGEVVLLEGENGSGKTTLLNIVTGNIEPDGGDLHYAAQGGMHAFRFGRAGTRRWSPETVARLGLGRSWQDTRLFGSLSLIDNIAVAEPHQAGEHPFASLLSPARAVERAVHARAAAALQRLALDDARASSISLGQAKRVAVARAVAGGAKVLLLDEPLAGLDADGIGSVLALLRQLVQEQAMTLIVVEHVLNHHHLDGFVTAHWELSEGRLKTRRAGPKTAAVDPRGPPRPTAKLDWLEDMAHGSASVVEVSLPRGAHMTRIRWTDGDGDPVLNLRGGEVWRGARRVVWGADADTGLDLCLNEGEVAVLHAPNGWGKSTLMRALAGLLPFARGELTLDERRLTRASSWRRSAAGLRFVPSQSPQFPSLSGAEVLRLARCDGGLPHGLARRAVSQMSGGERQRLALAALPPAGRAFLYDEPFGALDEGAVAWAVAAMRDQPGRCALITVPSN